MSEQRRVVRGIYEHEVVTVLRVEGDRAICELVEEGDVVEVDMPADDLGPLELAREEIERIETDVRFYAERRAPQAYRHIEWLAAHLREPASDHDLPRLDRELIAVLAESTTMNDAFVAAELARFRAAFAAIPADRQATWWKTNQDVWRPLGGALREIITANVGADAPNAETDAWFKRVHALRDRIEASRHAGFASDLDGTTAIATNPALEAAIEAAPDDDATWSVYADWLQQQGDPRGELAAVDGPPHDELVARHERYLLGGLPKHFEIVSYTWRRGWLRTAKVMTKRAHEEAGISQAALVTTLLALPSSRFLEMLTLGAASVHEDGVPEAVIDALVATGPRPTLRTFAFETDGEEEMLSWTTTGPLDRALPLYPNLTTLDLDAGEVVLGTLALPMLARLRIQTCGLTEDNLRSIIAAKLPLLRTLELWFGEHPMLDLAMAAVEAHPHITDLGIVNTSFTDELAAALAVSPSLAHRERLDLSRGTLTDAGALELARARADGRAPRLTAIDVSACYLTGDGIAALQRAGLDVSANDQRTVEEEGGTRYVDVWE
jgi:uncharacterized protein (TIGR02996 family)